MLIPRDVIQDHKFSLVCTSSLSSFKLEMPAFVRSRVIYYPSYTALERAMNRTTTNSLLVVELFISGIRSTETFGFRFLL